MARSIAIILLGMAATMAFPGSVETQAADTYTASKKSLTVTEYVEASPLTAEQEELVNHAIGRFDEQGLDLPEIEFVFHDDLLPCDGHKGRFHRNTRTLEMCSLDSITMLHELAHAWANENLTEQAKEHFVSSQGLSSWNDHDDAWDRRGTEHVAEAIAWALADNPHHVKWVETLPGGTIQTTHRILTLDIDVDTLLDTFKHITGMESAFRHPAEWTTDEPESTPISPELARLGG